MIKAIIAHALDGAIGKDNKLLWHLPRDLGYFKKITSDNPVIMGRKTFESLGMPTGLKGRDNWVITSADKGSIWQDNDFNEVTFDRCSEIHSILTSHKCGMDYWDLTIIGGASIYQEFWDYVEEVHITEVQSKFPDADTFYKPDLTDFEKVSEEIDVSSDELEAFVQVWRRKK